MASLTPVDIDEMNSIRWFHRIDLGDGVVTPGICPHTVNDATHRFGLPEDLSGKTVLDIGAWDGLFSFEAERRGAIVTAMDTPSDRGGNWGGTIGFNFARRHLGSNVQFVQCDVNDLDPATHGRFDVVFFFGVLYHLVNPLPALQNLFHVTKDVCLIETACSNHPDGGHLALWELAHGRDNDPTNYWYPTPMGLVSALQFAGFGRFEAIYCDGFRMTVRAYRTAPEANH